MNKLKWMFIIVVAVIIIGVYFIFTNNDTSDKFKSISTEQQDTKTTVSSLQNTETKIPVKSATNNKEVIPQPPKLPE